MACIWKSSTVVLAFYPSWLQKETPFTAGISSWCIIQMWSPVTSLNFNLSMLSLWLAQLSDDGHVELQDCLASIKNPCTLSETATAHFQELLSSASPPHASEIFQVFCSFHMSRDRGFQEVHVFLLWAHRGLQHCRKSMWAYSAIYIISKSSYLGNILKLMYNRHWTPRNVFCLVDNI